MTSTNKDIFWKLNSLASLACSVVGRYVIVDLRNDASVNGMIEDVDGFFNLTMSDAIFSDPAGIQFYFAHMFVKDRNIRYIHFPEEMQIDDSILHSLYKIKNPRSKIVKSGAAGFKASRLIQKQMETLKRVEEIKKEKLKKKLALRDSEASTSKS